MQSSRVRLMLVALLGVFAFSAVAAAAAQAEEAPFWSREGVRLGAGETHYITAKVYKVTSGTKEELSEGFTLAGGVNVVHCESIRLKEGVLLGSAAGNPGTNDEIIEFFGNCTITGNGSPCKPVEPIVTKNVKSELVESEKGEKGSLLTEFKPETGTQFVKLGFEGTGCVLKETLVTGSVAAKVLTDPNNGALGELVSLPNGKKEAKSWLLNFPAKPVKEVWLIKAGEGKTESIKLTAFSETSVLAGTALVLLANKELKTEEANWSPLP